MAVNGVWEAGLTTAVQPAAKAGPSFRVNMAAGKFHGVIRAQGPTASRKVRMTWPSGLSWVSPSSRSA
jgi:hypothetical protein